MNEKLIPRKYRKHAVKVIEDYQSAPNDRFKTLRDYLMFLIIGTDDGWIQTNDRERQAVSWLLDMIELFYGLDHKEENRHG